jgi:hypothetical protein
MSPRPLRAWRVASGAGVAAASPAAASAAARPVAVAAVQDRFQAGEAIGSFTRRGRSA